MSDARELDLELCQHATALRGIARDLLRDPHAADDVTQETLHRAMSRPPRQAGPIGGWLYRTLVNFAHQWRRSERRLEGRHSQLPRPEPAATPPDTLGRRETLRAVTNAVLALDEPYQTAIFLRYFEDLPPRAICRRTGANLATVKSRLQRGLVLLRARLDRQCGDREQWRMALLFTFGLPLSTAAAGLTATTGAWLLGTSAKTLIAAGLLCAGGLFAFTLGQDPPPLPTELARHGEAPAATPATNAAGDKTEPTEREAAANATDASLSWLDHPYLLELDTLVVDETGVPVEGHKLRLAPPGCTLNDAKAATGPDGRVTLSWRSRVPTGEVALADERGTLRRVALEHGRKTAIALAVTQQKKRGYGEVTLKVASRQTASRQPTARVGLEELAVRTVTMDAARGATPQGALHPYALFGDNAAAGVVKEKPESLELAFATGALLDSVKLQMGERPGESAPATTMARVAGTVFGEDGKPVAGAPVALFGSSPQPLQRTKTDDAGQFAFEKLLPGEFKVRAGGTAVGLASLPVVTTTGTTPATLNLRRESCIRGHACDASGKPLVRAFVVWRATDGSWCDSTETTADGSFVLANLPATGGTVLLWEPSGKFPLPVGVATKVLSDTADMLLKFDGAVCALQFELGVPDGTSADEVSGRVWSLDTGIGTRLQRPKAGKPWRLENLPAGWYQVEVFAPGSGWLDLGKHWLDGKGDCNLGRANLPAAATAKLALEPDAVAQGDHQQIELYELRSDVDVHLEGVALKPDSELRLPAGKYALAWRGQDGKVEFRRFEVRSGQSVDLGGKQ